MRIPLARRRTSSYRGTGRPVDPDGGDLGYDESHDLETSGAQEGRSTDRRSRRGVAGSSPAAVAGQPTRTRIWWLLRAAALADRVARLRHFGGLAERCRRQPVPLRAGAPR